MNVRKKLLSGIIALAAVIICFFVLPTEAHAASESDLSFTLNSDGASYSVTRCSEYASGDLTIPASYNNKPVTSINSSALWGCTNLTSITIPDSVTNIGSRAFLSCTSVTSITIPDSVTNIGEAAFGSCTKLTSITIPGSITSIGNNAFSSCYELTDVYITDPSAWCKINFYNDAANPMHYADRLHILDSSGNEVSNISLDNTVTIIPEGAFRNCIRLTSITIPNSVTYINTRAFRGCTNLTSVTIPDSVTFIGTEAFRGCTNLTSITIPGSITLIGNDAFLNCTGLTDVYITDPSAWCKILYTGVESNPMHYADRLHILDRSGNEARNISLDNTVTNIPYRAFSNCTGLINITIPDSVTSIDDAAFYNCNGLWHVWYTGTSTQWNSITISNSNGYLTQAIIHYECAGDEVFDLANKTCSICQANCTHTYGNWTSVNETTHKRTCPVCKKEETTTHEWNDGAVTQKPTCTKEGVKTYTCTNCGDIKTEDIDKLTTHTYDNVCDASCNVCAGTRTVPHQYSSSWSTSKNEHWHECSLCGNKKALAAHTPGAAATETSAQTCTTCGYIIAPALNHIHKYSNTLTNNREGHWYACSGCSEQKDYAAHIYDNACDTDCNACGFVRLITHNYSQDWAKDGTKHWHACTVCGEKTDEKNHVPGMQATETTAQTCTVCGYEIAPAMGATNPSATQPTTTPTESQEPTIAPTEQPDGNKTEEKGNNTIFILIGGIVLGGGAVVAVGFIILKKKGLFSK